GGGATLRTPGLVAERMAGSGRVRLLLLPPRPGAGDLAAEAGALRVAAARPQTGRAGVERLESVLRLTDGRRAGTRPAFPGVVRAHGSAPTGARGRPAEGRRIVLGAD